MQGMIRGNTPGAVRLRKRRAMLGSKRWKALSRAVRRAEPYCRPCLEEGSASPRRSTEVDHRRPSWEFPHLFWVRENLQGICRDHHIEKTRREAAARAAKRVRRLDLATGEVVGG